jgi:hypothetical protein
MTSTVGLSRFGNRRSAGRRGQCRDAPHGKRCGDFSLTLHARLPSTSWTPPAAGVYNITARVTYNTSSVLNTPSNKLTVSAPPVTPVTITNIVGTTLTYGGGAGSQFVLLGTNNVAASLTSWGRLATNGSTPGTFTVTPGSGNKFYRIKSE